MSVFRRVMGAVSIPDFSGDGSGSSHGFNFLGCFQGVSVTFRVFAYCHLVNAGMCLGAFGELLGHLSQAEKRGNRCLVLVCPPVPFGFPSSALRAIPGGPCRWPKANGVLLSILAAKGASERSEQLSNRSLRWGFLGPNGVCGCRGALLCLQAPSARTQVPCWLALATQTASRWSWGLALVRLWSRRASSAYSMVASAVE